MNRSNDGQIEALQREATLKKSGLGERLNALITHAPGRICVSRL